MNPFSIEQWQQTADYVLPVLLAEESVEKNNFHFWWALGELGLMPQHFPPGPWRDTYGAIHDTIMAREPVHLTVLKERLNEHTDIQRLAQWTAMYRTGSTLRGQVFDANVAILKTFGERARLIGVGEQFTADLKAGGDMDEAVSGALSMIANTDSVVIEGATADRLANDLRAYLGQEPEKSLLLGVQILDTWINGVAEGDMLSIAAPMKQRKTTLLLNILLHMARKTGLSVALLMFESNREAVTAQLVCMLATEYLIRQDLYGKNIVGESDQAPVELLKADDLLKLRARYKRWDKIRVAAVEYGLTEWGKVAKQFRIYDRRHDGLSNAASILRVALRDKALYKTDFLGIDHAQRVNERGTDYERLNIVVPFVETLARKEGVATCLLAQLNAESAEGVGDTHKTGVRGGTMLDEAVDYMITTGYRTKLPSGERTPINQMMVGLHLSRYGDGGSHKKALVDIAPNSGLILNKGRGTLVRRHGSDT